MKINSLATTVAALLLGVTLATTPVLAEKGGNGGGNGGGNSGNHSGGNGNGNGNAGNGGSSKSSGKSSAASKDKSEKLKKNTNGQMASSAGRLNGVLHASPQAIAQASPKSAIGRVAKVYGGLLSSYLNPAEGTTAPSIDDVAAALADAANKPLTPGLIAAVYQKLLSSSPTLAESLASSGKSAQQVNQEIAAALGV